MKFFIILLLNILFLFGCKDKIKPTAISTLDSETLPQQESWNSKIVVSDSGIVTAIIYAGYIKMLEYDKRTYMSNGVKVKFFNPQGINTSILTSEEGIVDETTNNLEAHKNVIVISSDSSKLTTEKLFWDHNKKLIYTRDYVQIFSQNDIVRGHGFESDQNIKNYRIFRVTGQSKTK